MKKNKPMSFDELLKDLQGQKTAQADPNQISLDELFSAAFMSKHSGFSSFSAFVEKGNFQVRNIEDIDNIPDEFWDRHVARETGFANWQSMLSAARAENGRS